tara:strand:+ start:243 stop:716 length:474 start_codon:yes stop_codon:yes gene_type:complete
MSSNWIIRIQDGKHFFANAKNGVWAIRNLTRYRNILNKMKKGDNLYFIQNKSSTNKNGLITAYGQFNNYSDRNSELINKENKERGWDKHQPIFGGIWDLEIKFTNFVDLRKETIGEVNSNKFITGISSKNVDAIMPKIEFEKFIDDFTEILNTIKVV